MSLRLKILSYVAVACLVCTASAVWVGKSRLDHGLHEQLKHKGEAILSRLESARKYVANQGLLEETSRDVVRRYPNGDLPDEVRQRILNVVPIYAALKIGAEDAAKDHYKFRVAAVDARRPENEATEKERAFLDRFEADPNLKEIVQRDEETNSYWVMRPIRISEKEGCLNCHGHPSTSPYKNGKDVLGFKMENWNDGYLHGMFAIISNEAPVEAEVKEAMANMFMWAGIILAIALGAVVLLIRRPIRALDAITSRLKETAEEGLHSSEELGEAAQTVSASTTEQAAGVQETMSSMSEMTAMISKTQDLASQTQTLSSDLDAKSKAGTGVMHGMVSSMESIKKSNDELKKMVQIIDDISTKTNVINDIVFKTQLLSVNASIEAARAGQHGKGFAVVAEEVGNLAQVSGKAAEEIREMLAKSQGHVQEVVNMTSERVHEGERVSQEAMKAFESISEGITKIQEYSQSVSEATNQQQEGITQISVAMNQMDRASQANSEMSTSVAHLSEGMLDQSHLLKRLSQETELLVYGKAQAPKPEDTLPSARGGKGKGLKQGARPSGSKVQELRKKLMSKTAPAGATAKPSSNGSEHFDADSSDFGSKVA